jgi:hypothetical protein
MQFIILQVQQHGAISLFEIQTVQAIRIPFSSTSSTAMLGAHSSNNGNSNSNSNNNSSNNKNQQLPNRNRNYYQIDDNDHNNNNNDNIDDDDHNRNNHQNGQTIFGSGREFNLFGERGGDVTFNSNGNGNSNGNSNTDESSSTSSLGRGVGGRVRNSHTNTPSSSQWPYRASSDYRKRRMKRNNSPSSSSSSSSTKKSPLSSLHQWIANGNLPKIQCRVEPNTTLKVRKTFRPLKTIVRLGADFNTQLGVWQFKSSWEDDVIGGKLTLAGRELQFSKTWLLSVGTYSYPYIFISCMYQRINVSYL